MQTVLLIIGAIYCLGGIVGGWIWLRRGGSAGVGAVIGPLAVVLIGAALVGVGLFGTGRHLPRRSTPTVQAIPTVARPERAGAGGKATDPATPDVAAAPTGRPTANRPGEDRLVAELRANMRVMQGLDEVIGEGDAQAAALRSQIARQQETIATQKRLLDDPALTEADRRAAAAAVAQAEEMNDLARAGLASYEARRTSVLDRRSQLAARNADIRQLAAR